MIDAAIRQRIPVLLAACSIAALVGHASARQQDAATADVVVVVDTSTSMREAGMDPERASLLVTKLLADIVPGHFAVVRLLDVSDDANLIPSRQTGRTLPCVDDPSSLCNEVEPATDWEAEARSKSFGTLVRQSRGDAAYKKSLEAHLEQRISNSMFSLAFRAAEGTLRQRDARGVPRTVIWLSDGRSESADAARRAIADLTREGVNVEAILFGRGDPQLAEASNLTPRRVSTPGEIMKAFAGSFRRIVQAPYEIDNVVSANPSFEMKRHVDEAWIVVYGEDSLGDVSIDGPNGSLKADYASDRWPGAGAYRVAYLERPAAGRWTVRASGGGPGVAYAVVQRSALTPVLLEPKRTISGAKVLLVAAIRAGAGGELITDPEVLRDLNVTLQMQGQTITLHDRGEEGDAAAADGRYSGPAVFTGSGSVPVRLRAQSPLVDRTADATVDVSGTFRHTGPPIEVDLGVLGAGAVACRQLEIGGEHQGVVPFALKALRRPPAGHTLDIRFPDGTLQPGSKAVTAKRDDRVEVCLTTSDRAPSSSSAGEPWLELHVAGSDAPDHNVIIKLRWQVNGLSFRERWLWLILLIATVLLLLFIALGFLLPHRFQPGLALVFVPERDELDEQTPEPIRQWSGVRIGFYRNARAFLHPDYRVSGSPRGALASLHAEKRGARVIPIRATPLYRETLEGQWEAVSADGQRVRGGDVFRIGDRGPYFRIATRGRV